MNVIPITDIPLIKSGDNLAEIIYKKILENGLTINDGDILVLAQKIISKAENRLINLGNVNPSKEAFEISKISEKDPRIVELILQESKRIIRCKKGVIISEHKNGFICANAGIDHSNVEGPYGDQENWVLLLPSDADKSAKNIGKMLEEISGKKVGILIIDSHGRPWRMGIVGTSIGIYQMPALLDLRGKEDIFKFKLKVTQIAVADELAGAASLVMGQADEKIPAVLVKDFPYQLDNGSILDLIRPEEQDLFR